ncbi:hypothetical protein [Helicovermis profundi]|uniref:Uncharacterized protein n=1 Tax=Helicovermis profundi TaxID=3065157 RepID=A0AAU9E1E7_9FIRM|nr:hypothetical protein HLPR_06150 [Clostridia bacterium S502]
MLLIVVSSFVILILEVLGFVVLKSNFDITHILFFHAFLTLILFFIQYKKSKFIGFSFLIILFVPIIGIAIYTIITSIILISERNSALDDYEKYISDFELILKKKPSTFIKEANTLGLIDTLIREDAKNKKKTITDLIANDVDIKIDALKLGLLDTDQEVVHYSSTLLSTIEREFEESLSNSINKYKESSDKSLLLEVINNYSKYLNSGLLEGELKVIHQKEYIDFLEKHFEIFQTKDTLLKIIRTYINLKKFKRSLEYYKILLSEFEEDKLTYFVGMELYYKTKDYDSVYNMANIIRKKKYFLTDEENKRLKYWS